MWKNIAYRLLIFAYDFFVSMHFKNKERRKALLIKELNEIERIKHQSLWQQLEQQAAAAAAQQASEQPQQVLEVASSEQPSEQRQANADNAEPTPITRL